MSNPISQRMQFDEIRYSHVWEDHRLLERSLKVTPADDILSICSAGCNVLNLLLLSPARVVAVDVSPAQLALLELKLRAIEHFTHDEFLALLGLHETLVALPSELYQRLRPHLSERARGFWDDRLDLLEQGVFRVGRLERYFHAFCAQHLWEAPVRPLVEAMFRASDAIEQAAIFDRIASPSFVEAFNAYFSREMLERYGRDPVQFEHVAVEDVSALFFTRFADVCRRLPAADNFYLELALLGEWRDPQRAHPYLAKDAFPTLQQRVSRVALERCDLEDYLTTLLPGTFSKANLSDIFEYMSEDHAAVTFAALSRALRRGGRLAYWNLLVPRQRPGELAAELQPLEPLSSQLHQEDRCWFYRSFHVDERL